MDIEKNPDKLSIKDLDEEINVNINPNLHEVNNRIFIISVAITPISIFLSYILKSILLLDFASSLMVIIISTILLSGVEHNFKFCKLIMGNFSLNDSEKVDKYIYNVSKIQKRKKKRGELETKIQELRKLKLGDQELKILERTAKRSKILETEITQIQKKRIQKNYLYPSVFLIMLFVIIIKYFKISTSFLIVPGLSSVSIGAALGILTFNYAKIVENNNTDNLIFSSAKRFYLSTVYAIFSLIFILVAYSMVPFVKNNIIFTPPVIIITYLKLCLFVGTLFLSFYLFTITLRYLYEGLVLVLKETIIFE